jgi:hypothetical protein
MRFVIYPETEQRPGGPVYVDMVNKVIEIRRDYWYDTIINRDLCTGDCDDHPS